MNAPHMTDHSSDQDLGAALGNALHDRVDSVPTLTPGFDGVERRAAQITRRRRALAGIATAAVVVLAGFGVARLTAEEDPTTDVFNPPDTEDVVPDDQPDPPDPTVAPDPPVPSETDDAAPSSDPAVAVGESGLATPMVAVRDNRVVRVELDGANTLVHESEAPLVGAHIAPDGTVVIVRETPSINELREVATEVVAIAADGTETVLSPDGVLPGVAEIGGRSFAFVGDIPDFLAPTEEQAAGDLRKVDLQSGESTVFIEDAYGLEWNISSVHRGGDRFLADWVARDVDGKLLGLPNPLDGRYGDPYGDPMADDQTLPWPSSPVMSPDGTTMWWIESPTETYNTETGVFDPIETVTIRSLVLDTAEDGPEIVVTFPVAPSRLFATLDFDGTRFLVSPYTSEFDPEGNGSTVVRYAPILVELDGTATTLDVSAAEYHYIDG